MYLTFNYECNLKTVSDLTFTDVSSLSKGDLDMKSQLFDRQLISLRPLIVDMVFVNCIKRDARRVVDEIVVVS